jgi:hypothetical protein
MENQQQHTECLYDKQYRRIQEGILTLILLGNLEAVTHTGKQEAINELMLHNTRMLSDISVASKHLTIAIEKDNLIEISYFKKLLAFHCYDLLYPLDGGITQLIMVLVRRFNKDLIKPLKLLKAIQSKRNEIIKINKAHFYYFKRIKHKIILTKRKGNGLQQYEILEIIDAKKVLKRSSGFIETFIELNTLLVELLQYLNTAGNKYSGDNSD